MILIVLWIVLLAFAVAFNVSMALLSWWAWRQYRRMDFLLLDCVAMSWAMHHVPTYAAWAKTLGRDLELEVSVRPHSQHTKLKLPVIPHDMTT